MTADADRRARLAARIAQALLVLAAAGLWAASRLPWVAVESFDGLGQPRTVTVSGASWSSALLPLALLALATAVAAVAVRGWLLRVLAMLMAAVSLAIGYLAICQWVLPDVAVRAADLAHVALLTVIGSRRYYAGAGIALTTAVGILAAAVLLMRAGSALGSTSRYAAPAVRRSLARREGEAVSERLIWDALDAGRDPTETKDDDTEGR
ncbi:TIGR02234 family membrane protein [Mycobacterium sp.]|uniref:TIGR02234 family membrane protein n=1 Tax=Mycobacterium sp. TaxID=1785 RepID=UPI00127F8ED0|nr:TIGR02234 family membrane protein [Mycobacterium sp.]KAA8969698.1 MAG: TIGR02234 family membrane protein [Mycobacterium sp.]